jgi:hypothetical protein
MSIYFAFFVIPFIIIWMAYLLTGFSFSTKEVFEGSMFWVLSVIYWASTLVATGSIMDENEKERKQLNKIK